MNEVFTEEFRKLLYVIVALIHRVYLRNSETH